jgi:hypothetical protein
VVRRLPNTVRVPSAFGSMGASFLDGACVGAPLSRKVGGPPIDRRDPTRPNPHAGTDIARRAAAGEG